jgi:hypothetical protein
VTDSDAHRESVEDWRAQRYAALRREIGWLTLVGLGWLKEGMNRVGADPAADVILPSGPASAGTITVADGVVLASGEFTHAGQRAHNLSLMSDRQGEPSCWSSVP